MKPKLQRFKRWYNDKTRTIIKSINESFNNYRLFFYIIIAGTSFLILVKNTNNDIHFEKKGILSALISIIGVIIVIIITFLFTKLFSERTIRIERKKDIDVLAIKVTYLRRIAFHLRSMYEFWQFGDKNIKSNIDYSYPNLTYELFRGYVEDTEKLSYEESVKINQEIGGTDGQAYLALKGLENGAKDYIMFSEFNPTNYSVKEILRFREYSGSFWYMIDGRLRNRSIDLDNFHILSIGELYFKLFGDQINKNGNYIPLGTRIKTE